MTGCRYHSFDKRVWVEDHWEIAKATRCSGCGKTEKQLWKEFTGTGPHKDETAPPCPNPVWTYVRSRTREDGTKVDEYRSGQHVRHRPRGEAWGSSMFGPNAPSPEVIAEMAKKFNQMFQPCKCKESKSNG